MRVIHLISSNIWGGEERYALDVCRGLADEGHSVTAYTRDAKVVDTPFRCAGIDLRHAPLGGFYDFGSARILARDLIHEPEHVIIHVHSFRDAFTALLARRISGCRKIKIVLTRHCCCRGKDTWLLRRIYRNLDAMVFVSRMAREQFISTWKGHRLPFPQERVHVLHNSINIDIPELCPEPGSGPRIAMFHGRLSEEKGVETLIDALPVLKGKATRLWIVGTGDPDYVDSLKLRAQMRGVMEMIDWKGHVEDVHKLIPQCHFGVLPSIWEEPFGLANIEYMAHGRPQICTDNGAQTEYMTSGHEAVMIPPGNVRGLSDALLEMSGSSDLRERLGQNAYDTFHSSLSWQCFMSGLMRIYNSL